MAYTVAALSANEIAWAAADKPMLSSNSAVVFDDMQWSATHLATWASGATDATGFEAYRAVDGLPGRVTKPNAAAINHTLLFDWSSNPIEFDWWGIMGHNLKTLQTYIFYVEIADDDAFTVRTHTIVSLNIHNEYTTNRRFADLTAGGGWRFTDVPYCRIGMVGVSGVPEIGQVIFGRRRQQQHQPTAPWDPTGEKSSMDDFLGRDGALSRQPRYKARREMNARWRHSLPAFHTDTLAWWDDIEEGGQPFYFTDQPASYPDDFSMMMLRDTSLRYPWTTGTTRDLNINAIEQGPTFFSLE